MHHRITYMYINFQQTRVSGSVKTVHTKIFANNRRLHKFATTNNNFEKKISSYNVLCKSMSSKLELVDQPKPYVYICNYQ